MAEQGRPRWASRVALSLFVTAVLAGCADKKEAGPRLIRDTHERFAVRGASVLPPRGDLWYRGRSDLLYTEFVKDVGRQGLHTVKASLWVQAVDPPILTGDALTHYVETSTRTDFGAPRFTIVSLSVVPESGRSAVCDRLEIVVEDRGTPGPVAVLLVVRGWEVLCVHPDSGGKVLVRVGESQRYVSPSHPVDVAAETAPMLQSLRFEPFE